MAFFSIHVTLRAFPFSLWMCSFIMVHTPDFVKRFTWSQENTSDTTSHLFLVALAVHYWFYVFIPFLLYLQLKKTMNNDQGYLIIAVLGVDVQKSGAGLTKRWKKLFWNQIRNPGGNRTAVKRVMYLNRGVAYCFLLILFYGPIISFEAYLWYYNILKIGLPHVAELAVP